MRGGNLSSSAPMEVPMGRRNGSVGGGNIRSSDIGVQPNEIAGREFLSQHHWPTGSESLNEMH